jgi:hypothetical protein
MIGGAAAYLLFTEPGRGVRKALESGLEDIMRELMSARDTVQTVAGVADEAWKMWTDTFGEGRAFEERYPAGQTSPF